MISKGYGLQLTISLTLLTLKDVGLSNSYWFDTQPACRKNVQIQKSEDQNLARMPINSFCHKLGIHSKYGLNSHASDSAAEIGGRLYLAGPTSEASRFHAEMITKLSSDPLSDKALVQTENLIGISTFDVYDESSEISTLIGLHEPTFGLKHQIKSGTNTWHLNRYVYGDLTKGVTITKPGSHFDQMSISVGQAFHQPPKTPLIEPSSRNTESETDSLVASFSYARATSLLYRTNFYLSYMYMPNGNNRTSVALLQSDYQNSTTSIEFVRIGPINTSSNQFVRITHLPAPSPLGRTFLQWDLLWGTFSKFSLIHAQPIRKMVGMEFELSHINNSSNNIGAQWELVVGLSTIL